MKMNINISGVKSYSVKDIQDSNDPILKKIKAFYFDYLAKTHPELGRSGCVCPFVPLALKYNKIYSLIVEEPNLSDEKIQSIVLEAADYMINLPEDAAISIFLPALTNPIKLLSIQKKCKITLLSKGLMVGEFFNGNPAPGLRNPLWRPLQCDIPCLGIRHTATEDLPFMTKNEYSLIEKFCYLSLYYWATSRRSISIMLAVVVLLFLFFTKPLALFQ